MESGFHRISVSGCERGGGGGWKCGVRNVGRARTPLRAVGGHQELGMPNSFMRSRRTRNARAEAWAGFSSQPEGLPEGSRRSPGAFWRRRPPGSGVREARHPGRGARAAGRRGSVWHPSGVREPKTHFPVVVRRLPRTTTGYPLPTLRVGFRLSRQNVQTPWHARSAPLASEGVWGRRLRLGACEKTDLRRAVGRPPAGETSVAPGD
jgi:hypothetical protein